MRGRVLIAVAWVFLACTVTAPRAVLAAEVRIRPLASFGGRETEANGINDAGQVVGRARVSSGQWHAALWEADGRVRDLGVVGGGTGSSARRINNAGLVAGSSLVAGGAEHAAVWDVGAGGVTDLGTFGGQRSFAQGLNEAGVVVGSSDAAQGSHAFTWTRAGGFVDYGNFNTQDRLANAGFNAVNASGLAVGTGFTLLEPYRAAVADPAKQSLVDWGAPGRTLSMATGINDRGMIVGFANPGTGPEQAAIFHGPGDFTLLGSLGLGESWAEDVNNAGDVVGAAFSPAAGYRPFLYRGGAMLDLTAMLPVGSGWDELFSATDVNERGDIVGTGRYHGVTTGYVLTVVPEPVACVPLGVAMGMLALRRRRGRGQNVLPQR